MRRSSSNPPVGVDSGATGRPWLRLAVAGVVLVVAASTLPLQAQESLNDARARQEQVRSQAAATAARLDLLRAEDAEVAQALADLQEYIALQEARLDAAEQALSMAVADQAASEAEAAELQVRIESLRADVTARSVEAFVQGSLAPDDILLSSSDPTDALLAEVLVSRANGVDVDITDQLRAAEAQRQAAVQRAEDAARRARDRRAEIDQRIGELEEARAAQEAIQAEISGRITDLESEAATLAAEDQRIRDFIRDEQQRAEEAARARRLEEQRQAEAARAAAAQAEAAAAEASPAPGGPSTVDPGPVETPSNGASTPTAPTPAAPPPAPDPTPAPPSVSNPSAGFVWPASGPVVSGFGNRVHPIYGTVRFHAGIDIDGPTGAPIWSAGSGVVIFTGWRDGYGNTVIVDHGNGLSTLYAHMSQISVSNGTSVSGGTPLGAMGATGLATGPHLHFEVRLNGAAVNPMGYLP